MSSNTPASSSPFRFLTLDEVSKYFPPSAQRFWPKGYRPSPNIAPFLHVTTKKSSSSSSAYPPVTLSHLIDAKKSMQSSDAATRAASGGSGLDDNNNNNGGNQPSIMPAASSSDGKSGSKYSYSLTGASPIARELPRNQRLHLEAAFLDFMSGEDAEWLSTRYDLSSSLPSSSSVPRLPWAQMSLNRRKKVLKKVTARDRPTLPSFIEMCEFLNLPLPCEELSPSRQQRQLRQGVPSSSSSPSPSASLTAEENLDVYLRSVPEELPCDVEVTDFRSKGTRMSRGQGTMGVKMGSDPSEAPRAVPIANLKPVIAAPGTYKHSMANVIRIYEREVARAERAAAAGKKKGSDDGSGSVAGGAEGPSSSSSSSSSSPSSLPPRPRFYNFTSYAEQQEIALQPLSHCESLDDPIALPTFAHLRDVLSIDYFNCFGVGNYLSSLTGDSIILTQELVTELALYLAKRWNAIAAEMATAEAAATTGGLLKKPGPILLPFGNGRLAYHLNETGIIPTRVFATSRLTEKFLYPSVLGIGSMYGEGGVSGGGGGSGNDRPLFNGMDLKDEVDRGIFRGKIPYPFSSAFFNTSTIRNKRIVEDCPLSPLPEGWGGGGYEHERASAAEEEKEGSGGGGLYGDLPPLKSDLYGTDTGSSTTQRSTSSSNNSSAANNSGNGSASDPALDPSFFASRYPITTGVSVAEALAVYQPSIVIAEPHQTRDYGSDMRGCASVKEVIFLGPVDSPAMGSFSFPWLTFGVSPSPDTYQIYNDLFQLQGSSSRGGGGRGGGGGVLASNSMQMPMDPPYMAQGYERLFIDRVSSLMIMPNDSADVPRQGRCLVFRRK